MPKLPNLKRGPRVRKGDLSPTVKTSIRLPRELWQQAHILAITTGRDLQDVIAKALAAFLKGGAR